MLLPGFAHFILLMKTHGCETDSRLCAIDAENCALTTRHSAEIVEENIQDASKGKRLIDN